MAFPNLKELRLIGIEAPPTHEFKYKKLERLYVDTGYKATKFECPNLTHIWMNAASKEVLDAIFSKERTPRLMRVVCDSTSQEAGVMAASRGVVILREREAKKKDAKMYSQTGFYSERTYFIEEDIWSF